MKRTLRIVLVGILAVTQWFQVSARNNDKDDPNKSTVQPTGKVKSIQNTAPLCLPRMW